MSIINNSGLKCKFNFSVQKIDLIAVQPFPPIFVENLVTARNEAWARLYFHRRL